MPLYEVEHCIPLSKAERDQLAAAFTQVHAKKFCTPSLFVNIRFTDTSNHNVYIGGEQRSVNRLLAFVRAGGNRTTTMLTDLAEALNDAWNSVVNGGQKGHGEREMKVISVVGAIGAGLESGFTLPPAGDDTAWLKSNLPEFEKLAAGGDDDFVGLLKEMRTREDLVKALS